MRRKSQLARTAWVLPMAGLGILVGLLLLSWDPRPVTDTSFDQSENGLWLGHRWFTGFGVRDAQPVTRENTEDLIQTFANRGIRYAFVHVGPVRPDGTIEDQPGPLLRQVMTQTPEVVWLAWLGARVEQLSLASSSFQTGLAQTIQSLQEAGFQGVHFDFEPLKDNHPGYLDVLESVRSQFGNDFLISQATPRAGPFGVSLEPFNGSFWSKSFYRETMERSDQTVVMAYDTGLDFTKGYVAFVKHQTQLIGQWACSVENHQFLIGVPSYEDVPIYSDPRVENLHTAALGVRSALEENPRSDCFSGIAIYAYWVTDPSEWATLEESWTFPGQSTD